MNCDIRQTNNQRFRRRALPHFPFCQWCRVPLTFEASTADHLLPRSRGGTDDPSNLCLACLDCNHQRGSCYTPGLRPRHGPADWQAVFYPQSRRAGRIPVAMTRRQREERQLRMMLASSREGNARAASGSRGAG